MSSSSILREDVKDVVRFILSLLGESGRVDYVVGHFDVFEQMDKKITDYELELIRKYVLSKRSFQASSAEDKRTLQTILKS